MNSTRFIAIADDHTMFRKGLIALISLFPGYEVLFEAGSGAECIERLEKGAVPDIMLMDIVMPAMDGYAASQWIKDHYPEIKVLALSTMDSETAIIRMIRSGARGYVLKDADPSELKKAFDEVTMLGYYYNEHVSRKVINAANLLRDNPDLNSTPHKISERERQFLQLSSSEKTYSEIAKEMFVSERTVDGYRESLFKKFNVTSRVGLVLYAIKNGYVHL